MARPATSLPPWNSTFVLPREDRADLLPRADEARAWLNGAGLSPADADVREVCASRLRELRAHVRDLLGAHVEDRPAPAKALHAVNTAMVRAPSTALLQYDAERGWHRAAAHPVTQRVDTALAAITVDLADLVTGTDSVRLARCGDASCERFLLRTHARGTWCSVRCGDRVRAARAYARRRGPDTRINPCTHTSVLTSRQ